MYSSKVMICLILSGKNLYRVRQYRSERRIWTTGIPQLGVSTGVNTCHSDFGLFFEMLAEAAV